MNGSVFVKGALEGLREGGDLYDQGIAISIANLNAWYRNIQALKDVNLSIPRNHITALIGPSGCGKTTLLCCLNRMNDLVAGFSRTGLVELDGEDVYAPEYNVMSLRKQVGMVFQDPNPFPMSIYNNLKLPLDENRRIDRRTADDIIIHKLMDAGLYDEVKLRLHKSALKLSGGQQQRLCIARALAIDPKVLLLDEPCSALDPVSTAKIETLLTKIKKQYTIIIVTHNLQQAARIADYVVYFYQGEIIEQGLAEEIFVNPKEKRTEDYLRGII